MKTRSYAKFNDGHEEDIFYYKDLQQGCILFATKSGVYFYRPAPKAPGVSGVCAQEFFTIQMDFCDNPTYFPDMFFHDDPYVQSIMIDRRIKRNFTVPGHGDGSVLVSPNASTEELACAIMSELGVEVEDI